MAVQGSRTCCIAQKPCVGCGPGADASERHSKLLCPSALHLTPHLDLENTEMNQTQSSSRKAWFSEYPRHSDTIEGLVDTNYGIVLQEHRAENEEGVPEGRFLGL